MNVTTLPTGSPSYITVRKFRAAHVVELVTPVEGAKAIRTRLAMFADGAPAIEYGKMVAGQMRRPFKEGAR